MTITFHRRPCDCASGNVAKAAAIHARGKYRQENAGRWNTIVALCNGGANAESNLGLTCSNCLPGKNAADAADRTITRAKRKAFLGIKRKSRPFPGSRNSRFKKHMDGTVSERT